jgi:hypothetical protein
MEVTFATLTDRNGVVQDTPTTWTARVSGTADFFPFADGARHFFFEHSEDGTINEPPDQINDEILYVQFEDQGGGTFWWSNYDPTFTDRGDWDVYRRTSSELLWTGFHDSGGDGSDVTITPGVRMVQLPPREGSWTIDATANDGTNTFNVEGMGETLGQEDLPFRLDLLGKREGFFAKADPEVFFKDAWKVELAFEAKAGTETFFTSERTLWFGANLGLVQAESYEQDLDEGSWDQTETYWLPFSPAD